MGGFGKYLSYGLGAAWLSGSLLLLAPWLSGSGEGEGKHTHARMLANMHTQAQAYNITHMHTHPFSVILRYHF